MIHFHVKKIMNVYGDGNRFDKILFRSKPRPSSSAWKSMAITLLASLILALVGIPTGVFWSKHTDRVRFMEEVEWLSPELELFTARGEISKLESYFNQGQYKYVTDIANRKGSDMSDSEKMLAAISFIKERQEHKAKELLSELANKPYSKYRQQAQYRLAYMHVCAHNTQGISLLSDIIEEEGHAYQEQALALYNHRMIRSLVLAAYEEARLENEKQTQKH